MEERRRFGISGVKIMKKDQKLIGKTVEYIEQFLEEYANEEERH